MRDEFQDESEREPINTPPPRRQLEPMDSGWGWSLIWICLFAMFVFAGWGMWRAPERVSSLPGTPAGTETAQDRLSQQIGENIAISGHAVRTDGSHAFLLSEDSLLGNKDMRVITRRPILAGLAGQAEQSSESNAQSTPENEQPLNMSTGSKARYKVEGKVELFNKENIEKEIGASLDDLDAAEYEGKSVIVADRVKPLEEVR